MRAASLGHQYLTVKSFQQNESFFGSTRRRGSQRLQSESNEQRQVPSSATEPISRRATKIQEQAETNSPISTRRASDSTLPSVIYKSNKAYEHLNEEAEPYSLVSILSKRRGSRDEDDKLSGRVRKFYKQQDEIIDSFEEVHTQYSNQSAVDERIKKQKRHMDLLIKATLVINCMLLLAKIVAAVFSKSLSIISSVVDSAVDSASACLLFWAIRAIKKRDPYTYPGGRTRLEPIIIVILSVIMVSASVQVIYESVESLISDVNAFQGNSTELRKIEMGPVPITVMCVTVICKAILSFLCFRLSNPTMRAVAQDHLNDVFSNIVALACGIIASKALDGSIKTREVTVIDPIGALLISLYIIFCWLKQLREQVRNLSGYAAEPEFLQKITWITINHSPLIQKIDTVRAFHFGISFLVEVELILPETMSLKEAHDIGASLKLKLENLSEVELAYVHLDYALEHETV
ncbi:hypothetical protein I4U23_007110 [Adineta vaga]|nr:hypothetical protein I4U23_007110 [Adineta vaga]